MPYAFSVPLYTPGDRVGGWAVRAKGSAGVSHFHAKADPRRNGELRSLIAGKSLRREHSIASNDGNPALVQPVENRKQPWCASREMS